MNTPAEATREPTPCECGHAKSDHEALEDGGLEVCAGDNEACRCMEYRPSTPSTPRTGAPSEATDALGRDWLDQAIDTLVLAIGAKGENGHILPGPARLLLENEVRRRLTPPDLGEIGTLLDRLMISDAQRAELDRALVSLQARAVRAERERETQRDVEEMLAGMLDRAKGGIGDVPRFWVIDNLQDILYVARAARPIPGEPK